MLPSFFAGRIFKMYTHACTFKKPAQRAGHILKKCIHLPAYFFDDFMHTHACTPFLLSQFCRHSSASFFCLFPPGVFAIVSQPFLFHFTGRHVYFFAPFQAFCSPFFALLFLRTLFTENAVHR